MENWTSIFRQSIEKKKEKKIMAIANLSAIHANVKKQGNYRLRLHIAMDIVHEI